MTISMMTFIMMVWKLLIVAICGEAAKGIVSKSVEAKNRIPR